MGRRGGRPSLKEGKSRVPSGRGRPFYIVARATPPAVGTGGVESVFFGWVFVRIKLLLNC